MSGSFVSEKYSWKDLISIVEKLRSPQGCPWDKKQNHQTLSPLILEEVYELIESIEDSNIEGIKEELGDVLLHIVLQSQIANENKEFNINDVIHNICQKIIRRHPHVFKKYQEISIEKIKYNWDQIKLNEKPERKNKFFNINKLLPALQYAQEIGNKTNKIKFDWSNSKEVEKKILEEWKEVNTAIKKNNQEEIAIELGDLLFTLVQYIRHLNFDAECLLRKANKKFEKRFKNMIKDCQKNNIDFNDLSEEEKEILWQKIKKL